MSVVIRLKVPIEIHYTVIPMGTSKVNSSRIGTFSFPIPITLTVFMPNIKIPAIQSIEANSRKKNKATTATRSKAHFIGCMHVNVYSPL